MRTLALLILLTMPCLAQDDAQQALLAFKEANNADMVSSLKRIPKGARIALWLTHGRLLEVTYIRYKAYDRSVWVRRDYALLAEAYDISEVQAVKILIRRSV